MKSGFRGKEDDARGTSEILECFSVSGTTFAAAVEDGGSRTWSGAAEPFPPTSHLTYYLNETSFSLSHNATYTNNLYASVYQIFFFDTLDGNKQRCCFLYG